MRPGSFLSEGKPLQPITNRLKYSQPGHSINASVGVKNFFKVLFSGSESPLLRFLLLYSRVVLRAWLGILLSIAIIKVCADAGMRQEKQCGCGNPNRNKAYSASGVFRADDRTGMGIYEITRLVDGYFLVGLHDAVVLPQQFRLTSPIRPQHDNERAAGIEGGYVEVGAKYHLQVFAQHNCGPGHALGRHAPILYLQLFDAKVVGQLGFKLMRCTRLLW